jgi:asparagine synthase (glutamine-hydrolysing)
MLELLPGNRNSKLGRKVWQAQKYADGLLLPAPDRYWQWCSVLEPTAVRSLLAKDYDVTEFARRKSEYLAYILPEGDMNDVLLADLHLVLVGDMLTKADSMSMANSLEVRVPFLDHTLVEWVAQLPAEFKLHGNMRKRILQDAARPYLPEMLYNRPKQGFEVPLRGWFLGPMRGYIEQQILNEEFIRTQGIFHYPTLLELWQAIQAGKNAKEDWTLWAVIVFQHWWRKYMV